MHALGLFVHRGFAARAFAVVVDRRVHSALGWITGPLLLFSFHGCSARDEMSVAVDSSADVSDLAAEDLAGRPCDPLVKSRGRVAVLVFVRTDCPISNRYAPTLRSLKEKFLPQGADFYVVYPDSNTTAEQIEQHQHEYDIGIPPVRDPHHVLVSRARATITPEAAVFARGGELVYHGRIDDRYVDFGKTRAAATAHDLRNAIEAALADRSVAVAETEAIGCFISDLQ